MKVVTLRGSLQGMNKEQILASKMKVIYEEVAPHLCDATRQLIQMGIKDAAQEPVAIIKEFPYACSEPTDRDAYIKEFARLIEEGYATNPTSMSEPQELMGLGSSMLVLWTFKS